VDARNFKNLIGCAIGWRTRPQQKAKATAESYRCTVDGFLAYLGDRARLGIEQVMPRDVRTFRDAQVKAGKSPQTANFYVKQLRIPFGLARKLG
jgi:hypothetical protein